MERDRKVDWNDQHWQNPEQARKQRNEGLYALEIAQIKLNVFLWIFIHVNAMQNKKKTSLARN